MPARTRMLALAALSACVALAAPAADRRETRAASGFTSVSLAAPIKVQLTQGDTEGVVLEGDESALAEIVTVVEDAVLKIRTKPRPGVDVSRVKAYVAARNVAKLSIAGSGNITSEALRSDNFTIAISGSGDVRIATLTSGHVEVAVSGSGDVTLGGKAESIATSIAGSGDLRAGKLEARRGKVNIAGSGDATLWARDDLEVKIVGSGDVRYYGDPKVSKGVMGSGTVKRAGAAPS